MIKHLLLDETVAREAFDDLVEQLHESGWDVMAVMCRHTSGGSDVVERTLMHGPSESDRAAAFLRCNRALRDRLSAAAAHLDRPAPLRLAEATQEGGNSSA